MKRLGRYGTTLLLVAAMMLPLVPGCTPVQAAEGYLVLVPEALQSGSEASVAFSLYGNDGPVRDRVAVRLMQGDKEVSKGTATVDGNGAVTLPVPDVADGEYTIVVSGTGFEQRASVVVEKTRVLFIETDKPIYKPGQMVHIRVLSLDPELKPLSTADMVRAAGFESVTAQVPGNFELDLHRAGIIPDPYFSTNIWDTEKYEYR